MWQHTHTDMHFHLCLIIQYLCLYILAIMDPQTAWVAVSTTEWHYSNCACNDDKIVAWLMQRMSLKYMYVCMYMHIHWMVYVNLWSHVTFCMCRYTLCVWGSTRTTSWDCYWKRSNLTLLGNMLSWSIQHPAKSKRYVQYSNTVQCCAH